MRTLRRLLAAMLALAAMAAPGPAQESVVTGLSADTIALNATFDGEELFVFGAVRREGPAPEDAGPLDIVITTKGPPVPVTVRRKERRFGIWVNTSSVRVRRTPSVYAIASTRPLVDLLTETERLRHQIGMDQAVRRVGSHPTLSDTRPFADAVVRLRLDNGLYAQMDGGVRLTEETLFQAHFELPANLIEGTYDAEFFLIRDKAVISSGTTEILVQKTGIERWIFNLAHDRPFLYGLFAVAIALVAGWLAAATFRLLRR